jgi:hypothetical protein
LLSKLGASRAEAAALLRAYGQASAAPQPRTEADGAPRPAAPGWAGFVPAAERSSCLDYLARRGFADPLLTSVAYDLRVARFGKWAGRLLIPFYEKRRVISWTGRAMGAAEPKYLTHESGDPGLLLVPGAAPARYHTGIIVEGPLDALRICAAMRSQGVHAAAFCGLSLHPAKQLRLAAFLADCSHAFLALDADVPLVMVMRIMDMLRPVIHLGKLSLRRLSMPEGYKDPGELSDPEIREWVSNAQCDWQRNRA